MVYYNPCSCIDIYSILVMYLPPPRTFFLRATAGADADSTSVLFVSRIFRMFRVSRIFRLLGNAQ